jgi:glycosyltransferase involved in cell wall biosynthesis
VNLPGQVKVTAVVPAFNEEQRIGAVIEVLRATDSVHGIVVVDDGSTDATADAALRNGHAGAVQGLASVHAIALARNVGKGGAMTAGVRQTDADVILFLDADLIGLTSAHVDALVGPVVSGEADMAVGIFRGGRAITDLSQFLVPYISGQRAIRRDVFLAVPRVETARFAVETMLTKYAKAHGLKVRSVPLFGVTHVMKEEKRGLLRGILDRARMYRDIARSLIRNGRG